MARTWCTVYKYKLYKTIYECHQWKQRHVYTYIHLWIKRINLFCLTLRDNLTFSVNKERAETRQIWLLGKHKVTLPPVNTIPLICRLGSYIEFDRYREYSNRYRYLQNLPYRTDFRYRYIGIIPIFSYRYRYQVSVPGIGTWYQYHTGYRSNSSLIPCKGLFTDEQRDMLDIIMFVYNMYKSFHLFVTRV